jgi:predicted O-methyltransferase YrrM
MTAEHRIPTIPASSSRPAAAAAEERRWRRIVGRAVAVPARALRHPSLIPELMRKLGAHLSSRSHRRRVGNYDLLSKDAGEAFADLLQVGSADVLASFRSDTLQELISELERYDPPRHTWAMGGPAFLEACYSLVRLTRPRLVVETGVAHGYSSAAILQAMEENDRGMLYSTDLPAFRPGVAPYTGASVPDRLRSSGRWQLLIGPDRRVLPSMLAEAGPVDVCFYDSDKSYRGMGKTLELVWRHLRRGGLLMVDDVEAHDGFLDFADRIGLATTIIAKPVGSGIYPSKRAYVGLLRKRPLEAL